MILFPEVATSLREHRKRQLEVKMACPNWEEHDYIFPSSRGMAQLGGNVLNRSLKPLLKDAGLRAFTFHDLRHGFVSYMVALGVDPTTVMSLTGHGDVGMTIGRYAHARKDVQVEAGERLRGLLFGD